MSCDVGEVTESLENQNELWRRWSDWKLGEWAARWRKWKSCDVGEAKEGLKLILQAFSHFTYDTAHSDSPSFPSLHLRHSSFSNPPLALPTSQTHSPTLPLLHLRRISFSNPSFASLMSQEFHLRHLASRPWAVGNESSSYLNDNQFVSPIQYINLNMPTRIQANCYSNKNVRP